jgi:signal transduction histidine kinase
LIEAQEVERTRIARDLHDDVSQQVAGVSIAFSGLKHRLGACQVSEELQQELVELQQQTLRLARNVRQLSHDLHPAVLEHLGLVKGLTSYCRELGRAHGVVMTCTAEGDFGAITPDAALCLYRIAQEALRNVVAHAGANRADVRVVHTGDQAQITIADDGRGFDSTNCAERDKGLGLVSMSERARIMGGTLRIVSRLNQGTQVQAAVPMTACVKVDVRPEAKGQVA